MAMKISTGLSNAMLASANFRTAFNNAELRIYAGTEPATADADIGAATLLVTIRGEGVDPLAFEAAAVNGALSKSAAQIWTGTAVTGGTATFCRLVQAADSGASSTTAPRVQGDVGVAGRFLNLTNPVISEGAPQRIGSFAIALPLQ